MGRSYPQDFIKDVLDIFDNDADIRRCLERGDAVIGRLLDDSSCGGVSPEEVVTLLKEGRQDELLQQAERLVRIRALYARWGKIVCPSKVA